MNIQTLKRLVAFKFEGVKVTNLVQVGEFQVEDKSTGKVYEAVEGDPKNIREVV